MGSTKVLITVTTYLLPSRSYDELVCTAGVLENGQWIRIYPVPLKFLKGLRKDGKIETFKYNWIELDLTKRQDDFRPESHSPLDYSFANVNILGKIDTKNNWRERKDYCLRNVYTNKANLLADSKDPKNVSLATFKPSKIISFEIEDDVREWKNEWKEIRKQGDLFDRDKSPEIQIPKLPYRFSYKFLDDEDILSTLMIEDWEIGALYWNCLRAAEGNEVLALKKVREKYEQEFLKEKDIYFSLEQQKNGICVGQITLLLLLEYFIQNKKSKFLYSKFLSLAQVSTCACYIIFKLTLICRCKYPGHSFTKMGIKT